MGDSSNRQLPFFGVQVAVPYIPIGKSPPSLTEVKEAASKFKGRKGAGICTISAELLKAGSEAMICCLHAVLSAIWQSGTIPSDWKKGLVIPIWKEKGGQKDCNNYCSITPFSVPAYVDLKKGFNLVHHGILWDLVQIHKIPARIIALICGLYSVAESAVKVIGGLGCSPRFTAQGGKSAMTSGPQEFGSLLDDIVHSVHAYDKDIEVLGRFT
ncbi:uncharacterized protein LOC143025679 [Oratosquilla oratoria]|uniref:uncharacterized protein LOC143025679 n=1 Tax=Oratosquilla oratoria TaxID=337810 RepID=UPI003F77648D